MGAPGVVSHSRGPMGVLRAATSLTGASGGGIVSRDWSTVLRGASDWVGGARLGEAVKDSRPSNHDNWDSENSVGLQVGLGSCDSSSTLLWSTP